MKHEATFEIELGDDLYGVVVTHFDRVEGDTGTWASDVDYYGYIESDWFLVDENGEKVEIALTEKQCNYIESEIAEFFAEGACYDD